MNVNPGDLDKRIMICAVTDSQQDEDGFETVGTEKVVRKCWAQFTQRSGTEILKSGSQFSETKDRFLVRASKTRITTDMYIRYAGSVYDIVYDNSYGDSGEYMELWTVKRKQE